MVLIDVSPPSLLTKLQSLWPPFCSTNVPHSFPCGYVEEGVKVERQRMENGQDMVADGGCSQERPEGAGGRG